MDHLNNLESDVLGCLRAIEKSSEVDDLSKIYSNIKGVRRLLARMNIVVSTLQHETDKIENKIKNKIANTGIPDIPTDTKITTKSVETEDEVPDSSLYFVRSTREFALRVNGVLIHGNIGEIYENSARPAQRTKYCRVGILCQDSKCEFYHPGRGEVRNFVNSQWLYTSDKLKGANKLMSHVGSRSQLARDLERIKKQDVRDAHDRAIHSLLVFLTADMHYEESSSSAATHADLGPERFLADLLFFKFGGTKLENRASSSLDSSSA